MEHGVLETLVAARKLLTPRKAWIKGSYGRTSPRSTLNLNGNCPEATCWCMEGALQKAANISHLYSRKGRKFVAAFSFITNNLPQFNDTHTHAEVLAAFDAAIEKFQKGSHE